MAAGAWKIYATAKQNIGDTVIDLGAGIFKMSLHRTSASGSIDGLSAVAIMSDIGSEVSAVGGYAAGGRTMAGVVWAAGVTAKQIHFDYQTAGLVFTASGAALSTIKYALIHWSVGAITSGPVLCYSTLSTSAFTIASPNTLTILPASTGVFTLA